MARISAGLVLLVRPRLLGGALGWNDGDRESTWLPRLVAVRELGLGIGAVSSWHRDADPWPWLMTMLGFLLLVTYVPQISLWLPRALGM